MRRPDSEFLMALLAANNPRMYAPPPKPQGPSAGQQVGQLLGAGKGLYDAYKLGSSAYSALTGASSAGAATAGSTAAATGAGAATSGAATTGAGSAAGAGGSSYLAAAAPYAVPAAAVLLTGITLARGFSEMAKNRTEKEQVRWRALARRGYQMPEFIQRRLNGEKHTDPTDMGDRAAFFERYGQDWAKASPDARRAVIQMVQDRGLGTERKGTLDIRNDVGFEREAGRVLGLSPDAIERNARLAAMQNALSPKIPTGGTTRSNTMESLAIEQARANPNSDLGELERFLENRMRPGYGATARQLNDYSPEAFRRRLTEQLGATTEPFPAQTPQSAMSLSAGDRRWMPTPEQRQQQRGAFEGVRRALQSQMGR